VYNNLPILKDRPALFWSLGAFSVLFGSTLGWLFAMSASLPALEALREYRPNVATRLLDRHGAPLGELFVERRFWIRYEAIPPQLRDAIVSVEDDQFFKHKGVRLTSILRAMLADLRKLSMAQGGSTITQQLAKTLFLSSEKSIGRKVKEALMAIEMEKRITKEEIFELYCNQIYLGSGAYGVEAASRIYFGKHAGTLSIAEAALIAGLPKAPEKYSPLKSPEAAMTRRAIVLERMKDEGYISAEEMEAARAEPLALAGQEGGAAALHFRDSVQAQLEKKFGTGGLYQEGLTAITTLDLTLQEAAEKAVADGLAQISEAEEKAGRKKDGSQIQAALVALDVKSGEILAMVGSAGYYQSQYNHATMARRQPGSAFKPFVYLAALEKGLNPATTLMDSPVAFPRPGGPGLWKPENYTGKFYGPVTMRFALENSLNVSTVRLLSQIGPEAGVKAARRLGVTSTLRPNLSLALGSSEVTLLELTAAYAALANKGMLNPPSFIRTISDSSGNVASGDGKTVEAVKPEVAFVLTNMLIGVVENGTGQMARIPGRQIAGKTGTTSDNRDAWFIGYTPDIATGVWVGYDDNRELGHHQTGGKAAAPIWAAFMREALKDVPNSQFQQPGAVTARMIDKRTGLLANQWCRDNISEMFVAGMEPNEYCPPPGKQSSRDY